MPTETAPLVRSVFFPTDFSPTSELAFAHALVIALLRQTRLVILHAHSDDADWTRFPGVRSTLERWGLLETGSPRSAIFDEFSMRVEKIAARGDPARETLDFIHESQPDLVVLGTHGRTGLARWLQPSVAQKIARKSRSMALFVPAEGRPFVDPENGRLTMRRILVPVDRVPNASEAVLRATRVAETFGDERVEIQLLHVNGSSFPPVEKPAGDRWSFSEEIRSGDVVQTILSEARQADLIVMATDGRDGVLDVFRGSFTERVVPEAPCPVLAVPAY
jgi:nucleotide-binding universal stress UspA family protein